MSLTLDPQTNSLSRLIYPDVAVRMARVFQDMYSHSFVNKDRTQGRVMRLSSGMRSFELQAKLYAQGRTAPGKIVTNAKPGTSWHNFGLAFDACFVGTDPFLEKLPEAEASAVWDQYGAFVKGHGLTWGGDFKKLPDRPHAQITYGLTLERARDLYLRGGIKSVWAACDQFRKVPQGSEWDRIGTQAVIAEPGRFPVA